MRGLKALLVASSLLVAPMASAATFTQSDFAGPGNYGTATAAFEADGTTVDVSINMAPNVLIDTGSHFLLTLSLLGTGRIDPLSVVFGAGTFTYDVLAHLTPPLNQQTGYANAPFKFFTDGLSADCGPGGSSGCGSTLSFHITDFQGFGAATELYNGLSILAAVDILLGNCTGTGPLGNGCTGVVGLTGDLTPTPFGTETPIPGAIWLFASGVGGLGWLARRRKKKAQEEVVAS